MKIVAAPNAFKGTLTAREAAQAMEAGIRRVLPDADVALVPVADGGDGLVEVAHHARGGELLEYTVSGPRREPVTAAIALVPEARSVAIEMALASGLALLPEDRRDPSVTTSYGTGELIAAALDLGAERIEIGIGGSATNDGGVGIASALGVRFLDREGASVEPVGGALASIASIDPSGLDPRARKARLEVVCDVDNPLLGPRGAARVFAPQKGASPEQVETLEAGLANLADVIERSLGVDVRNLPGGGAAGGAGAGLHAFLGAELRKGIDVVLDLVGLPEKIRGADLVLTGEGRLDEQTAFDKAPAGVGKAARAAGVRCYAIAGMVDGDAEALRACGIDRVFSLCSDAVSPEESMTRAAHHVERTTEEAMHEFLRETTAS